MTGTFPLRVKSILTGAPPTASLATLYGNPHSASVCSMHISSGVSSMADPKASQRKPARASNCMVSLAATAAPLAWSIIELGAAKAMLSTVRLARPASYRGSMLPCKRRLSSSRVRCQAVGPGDSLPPLAAWHTPLVNGTNTNFAPVRANRLQRSQVSSVQRSSSNPPTRSISPRPVCDRKRGDCVDHEEPIPVKCRVEGAESLLTVPVPGVGVVAEYENVARRPQAIDFREVAGVVFVVAIQVRDDIGARVGEGHVASGTHTMVGPCTEYTHAWIAHGPRREKLTATVCRTVVGAKQFPSGDRLRVQTRLRVQGFLAPLYTGMITETFGRTP